MEEQAQASLDLYTQDEFSHNNLSEIFTCVTKVNDYLQCEPH